ncbi:hypothetical protein, partial [Leucobacter sp. M11]|uniref:hypothetical protein n=1 Tax=Leucobacter sp. M11 TaxID=2993565 RepID=UPI002D7F33F9
APLAPGAQLPAGPYPGGPFPAAAFPGAQPPGAPGPGAGPRNSLSLISFFLAAASLLFGLVGSAWTVIYLRNADMDSYALFDAGQSILGVAKVVLALASGVLAGLALRRSAPARSRWAA